MRACSAGKSLSQSGSSLSPALSGRRHGFGRSRELSKVRQASPRQRAGPPTGARALPRDQDADRTNTAISCADRERQRKSFARGDLRWGPARHRVACAPRRAISALQLSCARTASRPARERRACISPIAVDDRLQEHARPIVIENQDLAQSFVRLLRARGMKLRPLG
jgi:hypothetical protein